MTCEVSNFRIDRPASLSGKLRGWSSADALQKTMLNKSFPFYTRRSLSVSQILLYLLPINNAPGPFRRIVYDNDRKVMGPVYRSATMDAIEDHTIYVSRRDEDGQIVGALMYYDPVVGSGET